MGDEENMKPVRIAVVGAGAVGLSTALCIQDRIRNCDVHIIAEKFSPSTTSDGSAGLWTPFLVPQDQIDIVTRWSMDTYRYLLGLFRSETAYRDGVQLISGFNFCQEVKTDPPWCKDVIGFRRLEEEELQDYPGKEFGIFYTAFTLDVPSLLSSYMRTFRDRGGFVIPKKLKSLQEVKAPWIKHFYIDIDRNNDVTYILPGIETVVLGGTAQDGDWNTEDDQADIDGIMERCLKVMPSLKDSKRQGAWAGLRPYRESVRLEIDRDTDNSKAKIVHNYGHGGAGLTIFWGCANDAAALVVDLVNSRKSKI
ncbi:D-amino-acid oxidase-like isoform X6 [Ostrea edulis]|uniref:D-amino-acid oxidase-like isoform X6 n=1 Tax=Ostrea edulis TaxID=37623 RepID=UPI0024AE8C85|nr:D-amino-acid oxidase-like isoform X6 [Ostrea edulis]